MDPLEVFGVWYREATASGCEEPDAMALATADGEGRPSVRIVLFRGVTRSGIRFFTNYESRKGREIERNSACAAVFYWPRISKQVRFEGQAERLSQAESDAYFASRPLGHRISAWASAQSRILPDREALLSRWEGLSHTYQTGPLVRPHHWGGYVIVPQSVEFWIAGEDRLHHRTRYERQASSWVSVELEP
jgi:pyridoxamine 5'-phosphate oxidase